MVVQLVRHHGPASRVKVACINWLLNDAPHAAVLVFDAYSELIAASYFETWADAMAWANDIGGRVERLKRGSQ